MKPNLFIFSARYPYGSGEVFLGNELGVIASFFETIYLFPANNTGEARLVPGNCKVINLASKYNSLVLLRNNWTLINEIILSELINTNNRSYFLKTIKRQLGSILSSINRANQIKEIIPEGKNYFYSYWMNEWALACSILRRTNTIQDFIFRVHGFDLYNYNRPGNYIPFRYFNMKHSRKVLTVSKEGEKYLKAWNIFPDKVSCSYLGVFDNGINPFNRNTDYTIVTCSNFNINKRIQLWIEVLKQVNVPVTWIHFGGGGDLKLEVIKNSAASLPPNVKVELKGAVSNNDLMKFYQTTPVHLFVNVSASEGLPVTLMEAASFGIPMIATNVGGVGEIVNNGTGYLIDKDFKINYVASIINEFFNSSKNNQDFRKEIREVWHTKFNALNNYSNLLKHFKA